MVLMRAASWGSRTTNLKQYKVYSYEYILNVLKDQMIMKYFYFHVVGKATYVDTRDLQCLDTLTSIQ